MSWQARLLLLEMDAWRVVQIELPLLIRCWLDRDVGL